MWCEEAPRGGGSRSGQGHRLTHKVAAGLRMGAVCKQAGVGGHRTHFRSAVSSCANASGLPSSPFRLNHSPPETLAVKRDGHRESSGAREHLSNSRTPKHASRTQSGRQSRAGAGTEDTSAGTRPLLPKPRKICNPHPEPLKTHTGEKGVPELTKIKLHGAGRMGTQNRN